jgi:hypothetical protein
MVPELPDPTLDHEETSLGSAIAPFNALAAAVAGLAR